LERHELQILQAESGGLLPQSFLLNAIAHNDKPEGLVRKLMSCLQHWFKIRIVSESARIHGQKFISHAKFGTERIVTETRANSNRVSPIWNHRDFRLRDSFVP